LPAPLYVAAYDVEADVSVSVPAARAVAAVHRRLDAPATFFIVTRLLEEAADEFRAILDHQLFDIQSHTHTHAYLKRTPPAEAIDGDLRYEIERPVELIRDIFGREAIGLTAAGAYTDGLVGQTALLRFLRDSGIRFIRSDGRGPDETLPALFTQPYWHGADGCPELLELPVQFWHDNVLKGYSPADVRWPPVVPFGLPVAPPESPEAELAVWQQGADYVKAAGLRVYQPAFHPWSVCRMSPEARQVELLLRYVLAEGFEVVSCRQLCELAADGAEQFPETKPPAPPSVPCDAARASFLSAAHHDLRAPMTPILGHADALSTGFLGRLTGQQQPAADEIAASAERQHYLFQTLVAAEKASAHRIPLDPEILSLEAVGRQVAVKAEGLPGGGPDLTWTVEPEARAVHADETAVLLILDALLRNSAAFHTARARVTVHARREGERVLIEVADDGPGMTDEVAAKAFVPLVRGQDPKAGFPRGLGLGLTYAADLARLLGGELRLLRDRTPGTTLVLELPAAEPPTD